MNLQNSESAAKSRAPNPQLRVLVVLSLFTAVLALLVFWPSRTRLPVDAEPLRAPIAVDEPVVHLWK